MEGFILPNSLTISTDMSVQDTIDALIVYIDEAVSRGSVSNRHVAAVLDFLNQKQKSFTQDSIPKDCVSSDISAMLDPHDTTCFVVDTFTIDPASLLRCRYVITFMSPVVNVDTNGLSWLTIGGVRKSIRFQGSNASLSNTWQFGSTLDVWFQNNQWCCSLVDYPHVSYESWGSIDPISRPF